jgi:hypothetical protein
MFEDQAPDDGVKAISSNQQIERARRTVPKADAHLAPVVLESEDRVPQDRLDLTGQRAME